MNVEVGREVYANYNQVHFSATFFPTFATPLHQTADFSRLTKASAIA